MIELKKKVIGGFSWMLFAQFGRQVIQFSLIAVLARILSPEDFGLIGIVLVFSGLIVSVWNVIGSALIQRSDLVQEQWSSVFWLIVCLGLFFAGLFYFSRSYVAGYFEEPDLTYLIPIICLQIVFSALFCVPMSLLRRRLDFKKIAIVEVGSIVFGGVVALSLAVNVRNASALAWQATAISFFVTAGSWWYLKTRPSLRYRTSHILEFTGYSLPLFGSTLISYLIRAGDRLVIGKFLGSFQLGLYTISNSTMKTPIDLIGVVAGKVMFPSLSLIKDDFPRFRSGYLKTVGMLAVFLFPTMLLGYILGTEVIMIVLGEKWVDAIPVFKIFCLVGIIKPLNMTFAWIFMSQGKTKIQLYWFFGSGAVFFIAIFVGSQYGVIGTVLGVLVHAIITTPIHYKIAGSFVGLKFSDVWRSLKEVFFASILLFFVTFPLYKFLEFRCSMILRVVLCAGLGMAVYLAFLAVSNSDIVREIKSTIKTVLASRK